MTKEDIIRMAREAGIVFDDRAAPFYERLIHSAYAAGAAAEREACAKVCEDLDWSQDSTWQVATLDCAAAIRSRSSEHCARDEATSRGQT